jgi:hypothetical protein
VIEDSSTNFGVIMKYYDDDFCHATWVKGLDHGQALSRNPPDYH